ncbi:MAG: glycosyltransferase [Chthoniobacterales bacterium]
MIWLAGLALLCAVGPTLLFLRNLAALRPPPAAPSPNAPAAVLIPARDEEPNIAAAVEAGLASGAAEVLVLDDDSSDQTAAIVRQLALRDPRVRLIEGQPLPPGWLGKNFACAQLAEATSQPVLIFVDADVCLTTCAAPRLAAFLHEANAQLASGVPRQMTGTFSEQLLVPLIQFLLLGFLPLERMRASRHQAYGTGCGQLFVADAEAYRASGGHAAMRASVHDGLSLPKRFRARGFMTDLCDATDVATCRMYRSNREVWRGLGKNVVEGLGAPAIIGPATLILLLGQVLPFALLFAKSTAVFALALLGCVSVFVLRFAALRRFHQPWLGLILHPLAIVALLGIQWFGLLRHLAGRPARWKGRSLGRTT